MHGAIPDDLFVLHRCDVRSCVNPEHLFLGTAQDNTDDMFAKGRQPKRETHASPGSANPNAKLCESDVRAIRRRYAGGEPRKELAAAYGIRPSHVGLIVTGHAWKHIL